MLLNTKVYDEPGSPLPTPTAWWADARCNDESPAKFFFRPYSGEANRNRWTFIAAAACAVPSGSYPTIGSAIAEHFDELKAEHLNVTDVDKSGFFEVAQPYLDTLSKQLGTHAIKIRQLIGSAVLGTGLGRILPAGDRSAVLDRKSVV